MSLPEVTGRPGRPQWPSAGLPIPANFFLRRCEQLRKRPAAIRRIGSRPLLESWVTSAIIDVGGPGGGSRRGNGGGRCGGEYGRG